MLPYDVTMTVTTDDNIALHVEIVEPLVDTGRPTLVFAHGFCLDQGTFHFQRKFLDERGGHRMVFYDQPGHGFSTSLKEGEYELPALGDALNDVIKAAVPTGKIVLIGHSMGGMTIMALAEQHPDLFTDRVCGVILIATSGGQLDGSRLFGLSDLISRAAPSVMTIVKGASRLSGGMIDKLRLASTDLAWLLTRRYGFGGEKPSPALVSYVEKMNSRTSTDTVARYLRTIYSHARYPALRTLEHLPVLLISGEKDMITPLAHSEEIARLLPRARYVKIANSGHVVMLECADEVNAAIQGFLEQM
jgi:pimeloyl-ACP methyl ester carboxylesterase